MKVKFSEIFRKSLKYPLRLNIFVLMFFVNLIFGVLGWIINIQIFGSELITESLFTQTSIFEKFFQYLILIIPLQIIFFVVVIFITPMYFDNISHFYKGKKKMLHESFEISKKRFIDLLVLSIIIGLILLICFGGLFVAMYSALISKNLVVLGIAGIWFIIGTIIAIILSFMLFISPAICVLEKSKPLDSLKKSWSLISKNKLNTFIFLVILILFYLIISLIGSLPEATYLYLSESLIISSPIINFIFSIIRIFVNTYLILFSYCSIVFYYLSIRKKLL